MTLGTLQDLIDRLGGKIGMTKASAIKKAAGYSGPVFFDVDGAVAWLEKNPGFKTTDVFPARSNQRTRPNRKGATSGKSYER